MKQESERVRNVKIQLDDTHFLNSDQYCFWITCLVTPGEKSRKKKPYEVRVSGYLPTFEQAVESFIDRFANESTATSLNKLKQDIQKLKAEVRAWKNVKV